MASSKALRIGNVVSVPVAGLFVIIQQRQGLFHV